MPEMSGQHLAERLGEQRPDMKVLFTSGYNQGSIPVTAIGQGQFIQKPGSGAALCRRIREMIDGEADSQPQAPDRYGELS